MKIGEDLYTRGPHRDFYSCGAEHMLFFILSGACHRLSGACHTLAIASALGGASRRPPPLSRDERDIRHIKKVNLKKKGEDKNHDEKNPPKKNSVIVESMCFQEKTLNMKDL